MEVCSIIRRTTKPNGARALRHSWLTETILNRACIFALLNRARVLVKFKKKFPPNDKAEPAPMISWNSYAYVSTLYFASDSSCLCLGV